MTETPEWPRIAVVGAGAVGGYFGAVLARAGAPVTLIGRKPFADAVNARGLIIDRGGVEERIAVSATTEIKAVADAGLVLFCVKSNDTAAAAREIAPFLSADAVVVSVQNGVDNVSRMRDAAKIEALPAAVYIAVSVPEPGRIRYLARGDLVLGRAGRRTEWVSKVFERAGIGCCLTDNIEGEMWVKLLCNCALNAISALARARYGEIAANADARQLMQRIVDEVLAVAAAEKIRLPGISDGDAGMKAAMAIATQMVEAFSSTAQDIQLGKKTEIDALNGHIAKRGAELGVDVPVNQALFALLKLAEKAQ